MITYKRHRFPHLGGPPNHQLRGMALLQIQSELRDIEDQLDESGVTVTLHSGAQHIGRIGDLSP
jgi:hypothetical protein